MSDINVYITSDLTSSERRISPQWDLQYFKGKLELITGIAPLNQTIKIFRDPMSNDYSIISSAKNYSEDRDRIVHLADFDIGPYARLHIEDEDSQSQLKQLDFDKDDNFEHFTLTEEEYAKRNDTVLAWKKRQKLGRFDPNYELERKKMLEGSLQQPQAPEVGDRCRVINIEGERRGTIRYIGRIKELDDGEDVWAGIEFDEPVGKNDGKISDIRLFQCRAKHGSFVRSKRVEVGDFPPFSIEDELDEI